MAKNHTFLLIWLVAIFALTATTLMLTVPSWSSPAPFFVTTSAPKNLPPPDGTITLNGGGFSPTTSLWLVPELSLRSATTATLETFGYPQHLIRRDDHIYVANGAGGFLIVQGVQSSVPFVGGVLNSDGQGIEIVLRQNEALMAAGNDGLQIIDIRDDLKPQLLSTLKMVVPALSVASAGKIAYVATGKNGVQLVDLTDPRRPQRLGQLANLPVAYKLFCDDELLIIATGSGGVIYDISAPEQPRRLAHLQIASGINTVLTRHEETLYWATKTLQESRLYSIDLSRPTAPRVITSVPLNGTPNGISCTDEQVAIALGSVGTQIFSLTDKDHLAPVTTISAKSRTRFALFLGNDLWVADGGGEMLRINQQEATALAMPAALTGFSPKIRPLVTPQLLFLGDETGLAIYEHRDGSAPLLLARLPITGLEQQYLSADQRQLWLAIRNAAPASTGKLLSIDVSIPQAPQITAEIPLPRPPVIVGEQGTTLVIATTTLYQTRPRIRTDLLDSLHFIDISLPESPSLFLTYPLADSSQGVSMMDHYVVLMQKDGLFRVLNLSETHAPKELGSLQMPWLNAAAWSARVNIVVKDQVAFVSSLLGEIFAIDLHDLQHPKNLGVLTLKGPVSSLLLSDTFLLAEVKNEGLVVINLQNPLEPELLGTIPLPGLVHNCTTQAGTLWYIISDVSGIWSFPLPRRLKSAVAGDNQINVSLEESPPAGAYRFWLTDQQNHFVVPGVSWSKAR